MLKRAASQILSSRVSQQSMRSTRPLALAARRQISSTTISPSTFNPSDVPQEPVVDKSKEEAEESEDIPWYLRSEESSTLSTPIFKAEMPEIPTDSPEFVEPIVRSLIDLGLDDLKLFDLRGREEELPLAQNMSFALVCQGKSPKHIQNAAEQLSTLLKKNHDIIPFVEGLIKPNSTLRMKRRLKQKKPVNDFGLGVNSWVMVDTQLGLMINLLTPERRKQVNLEYLWCTPEERPLYEPKGEIDTTDSDSVFAGIFRRFYSTTPTDVPFEVKAVQCFQLSDFNTFEKEIVPTLRADPSRALSVLDTLITSLKSTDVNTLVGVSDEEATNKSKEIFTFINACTPTTPSASHWDKRFEAISILSTIFPHEVPVRHLTNSLILQAGSGVSITEKQLGEFIDTISMNLVLSPPSKIMNQAEVDHASRAKLDQFSRVMEVYGAQERGQLSDEVVLKVLKLGTQQHMYLRTDEIVPVSGVFDVLLDLFGQRYPSLEIVEFVLVTYLKANETGKFWKFWDSLHEYSVTQDGEGVIVDNRPWALLTDLLVENDYEKFIEELLNRRLPEAVDLGAPVTDELKENVTTIINRFDETGRAYDNLRRVFA